MSLGFAIGKGNSLADILNMEEIRSQRELQLVKAAYNLGKKYNLNLEIINLIYKIIYEQKQISVSDFF